MREKGLEECGEGSATVAEGEFGLDVELGHGLVLMGEIEEWVVAEAVGTARCGEDFSFDGAVACGEDFSVACGGENAVVACGWIQVWDLADGFEEAEVVALVCGCSRGTGEVVVVGVTGGADAGGSVEDVDLEAGVVGDDDFVEDVVGVVEGFEAGVAFESRFVFGGGGDFF